MRQTKTVRAQQNTCNAQTRKVKPFCHLTRKGPLLEKVKQTSVRSHRNGTVPEKTNVISQERDCSKPNRLLCHLTRKPLLTKQTVVSPHKKWTASQTDKDPNKIVATDHKMRADLWNLVTTCGMALRLEILIAGSSVSLQAWSSSALNGYSNIFLIALETRPVLYNG